MSHSFEGLTRSIPTLLAFYPAPVITAPIGVISDTTPDVVFTLPEGAISATVRIYNDDDALVYENTNATSPHTVTTTLTRADGPFTVQVRANPAGVWASAAFEYLIFDINESYPTNYSAPIPTPLNGITYQRNALWEVADGVAQTTASASDSPLPIAYGSGMTRATGRALAVRVAQNPQGPGPNETVSPAVGWSTTPGGVGASQLTGLYFFTSAGQFSSTEPGQSAGLFGLIANAVSTFYECVHILRGMGGISIVGDRLAFVHKQGNTATLYPSVGQPAPNRHTPRLDYFRVARLAGGWWDDDYGIWTTRLAGARSVGNTFTHEASNFWCEFMLTTLPGSGSIEIDIRRQDANNKWQLQVTSAGAFNLIEVVAGSPATQATVASNLAGDRLMCVMDGSQARLLRWRSGATAQSGIYSSVATFTTQTQGEIISLGTGGAISDLETYPCIIPAAAYAWVQALRAG